MASNKLSALSAVSGSLIYGLRAYEYFTVRKVLLGLSAGFITFFAIKGGKTIIVLDGTSGFAPMNPYGGAFLGVLSGLFTERAFSLLRDVVDAAESKLRNATGISSGEPGANEPVAEDESSGSEENKAASDAGDQKQ